MTDSGTRLILLNRLVSRSATRAREHDPPIHDARELLGILEGRAKRGWAIEFAPPVDERDEAKRVRLGAGRSFLRLSQFEFSKADGGDYATLLFEHVDQTVRSFPVVHTLKLTGREISGDDAERGATAAHMVVQLPPQGRYDDGSYRCAIEAMPAISRKLIEDFLCHQLRRHSGDEGWAFSAVVQRGRSKPKPVSYRYWPRLELHADVGRALNGSKLTVRELTHMLFTKRSERQSIGQPTAVQQQDVLCDVNVRVSAKQAPEDAEERKTWAMKVRGWYEAHGFETQMFYRHPTGGAISGEIHPDIAGAADLLMCPRELITFTEPLKTWAPQINAAICGEMRNLLERDELWQRRA